VALCAVPCCALYSMLPWPHAHQRHQIAERREQMRLDAARAQRLQAQRWAAQQASARARQARRSDSLLQSFAQAARGYISGTATLNELVGSLEGILQPGDDRSKVRRQLRRQLRTSQLTSFTPRRRRRRRWRLARLGALLPSCCLACCSRCPRRVCARSGGYWCRW
jgi:hypothetical protein